MSIPKSRTIDLTNDEAALLSAACQWAVNVCHREINSWSSSSFYDEDAGVWRQEQYKDYNPRDYALHFALLTICSRVHQELNSGIPLFPDEKSQYRVSVYRYEEGALQQAVMMFVMDREAWVKNEIEQDSGDECMTPKQAAEFRAYREDRHKELARHYKRVCEALDPINAKRAP